MIVQYCGKFPDDTLEYNFRLSKDGYCFFNEQMRGSHQLDLMFEVYKL